MLHGFVQWNAIEHLEQFVRTGESLNIHEQLTGEQWPAYIGAMKSIAGLAAREMVARMELPAGATTMLDVGGSHGLYSVEFCRRHPSLSAVVLDLPVVVERAAPFLASEGMGARVVHRAGDALTDDLGAQQWDFVFVSQLFHHGTAETNQTICHKIRRSLKPGGIVAVAEIVAAPDPRAGGQMNNVFDLYFASTSQSGIWPVEALQQWLTNAGLKPRPPLRLWTVPGVAVAIAEAPADEPNR
jgi:predicted O-methyltransferase YrrM